MLHENEYKKNPSEDQGVHMKTELNQEKGERDIAVVVIGWYTF